MSLGACSSLHWRYVFSAFQCVCGNAGEGVGGALGGYWVSLIKAKSLVSAEECAGHETAYIHWHWRVMCAHLEQRSSRVINKEAFTQNGALLWLTADCMVLMPWLLCFLALKARGLFVSFLSFMNKGGLNVHRKIKLRLEMKLISLDSE